MKHAYTEQLEEINNAEKALYFLTGIITGVCAMGAVVMFLVAKL